MPLVRSETSKLDNESSLCVRNVSYNSFVAEGPKQAGQGTRVKKSKKGLYKTTEGFSGEIYSTPFVQHHRGKNTPIPSGFQIWDVSCKGTEPFQ